MKTFKSWFLSFLIVSPQLSWALGEACPEDSVAGKFSVEEEQEEYGRLLVQLEKDFSSWETAAAESIKKSLECLDSDASHEDCQMRLNYFFQVLPGELKIYRQNLALSRWDTGYFKRVLRDKIDEESPYNWQLKNAGAFYRGHADPEPLVKGSEEHQEIQALFERKIEVDFKAVLDEWNSDAYIHETPEEVARQKKLVEDRDLHSILVDPSQNYIARQVIERFKGRVFVLSKKRMANQLISHPMLAMISTKDVTKDSLLQALSRMQINLEEEYAEIQKEFQKIQGNLDNPEVNVVSRHFYPLLDYTMITESIGVQDSSLCPIIKLVDKHYTRSQWVKIGLGGAALVGLIALTFYFSVPILLVVGGSTAVSGYMVYDANKELNQTANRTFLSPEERLNLADSNDMYEASEQFNDEVYLYAPLTVVMAGPLLKIGKVFKFLRSN